MKFFVLNLHRRCLLLLSTFLLTQSFLYAQKPFDNKAKDVDNAEAINEWVQAMIAGYRTPTMDSVNLWTYRNGFDRYNTYNMFLGRNNTTFYFNAEHRWLSLLSDDLFVPVFGKPADNMPAPVIKKIAASLKYYIDHKAPADVSVLLSPLCNELNYGISVKRMAEIQAIRVTKQSYLLEMSKLSDHNKLLSQQEFDNFPLSSYKALLPTQIMALTRALQQAKEGNNDRLAQQKLDAVLNMSPGPPAVYRTIGFLKENGYTSTDKISSDLLAKFRQQLNQHLQDLIKTLMDAEAKKIESIPAGEAGIEPGNELYKNFQKNYVFSFNNDPDYLGKHPAIVKIKEKYRASRNLSLQLLKTELEKRINTTTSVAGLTALHNKYLNYLADSDNTGTKPEIVQALSAAIDARKAKLGQNIYGIAESIDADIKKQKDEYLKKITAKDRKIKFGGLKNPYYQQAYLRDIAAYNNDIPTPDIPSSLAGLLFKMLVGMYSEKCDKYLPADKKEVNIKVFTQTGTIITNRITSKGIIPGPATVDLNWVTLATFHMNPEFAHTFENIRNSNLSGDIWELLLTRSKHESLLKDLKEKTLSILQDAATLIDSNGCACAGLNTIMNNLHYTLTQFREPVRPEYFKEEDYLYNETGNYYQVEKNGVLERHYMDALPNFVPPLLNPSDSNLFRHIYNIHHSDLRSTGITRIEVGVSGYYNMDLTTKYVDGKPVAHYQDPTSGKLIPVPADIESEFKANSGSYYIIEVQYNKRYAGVLETRKAKFWYSKGKAPSEKMQAFFTGIKKPVDKIQLQYNLDE